MQGTPPSAANKGRTSGRLGVEGAVGWSALLLQNLEFGTVRKTFVSNLTTHSLLE